ncbi:MAG: F0F1 ATP synthase subunit alpha, partial [Actinomycetota bacterium]
FSGTKGYLDDLPVADVRRFESELLEHMRSRHGSLLAGIRQNPKADVPKDLADIVAAFKKSFAVTSAAQAAADPTKSSAGEVGEAASKKTLATE